MVTRPVRAILGLALLLAAAPTQAAEPDFSLTSEIESRFEAGQLDAIPEVQPVLPSAWSLTRHVLGRVTPSDNLYSPEWARCAPLYMAWRHAHLEDDVDSSLDRPTFVEAAIAKGFLKGRTTATPATANHFIAPKTEPIETPSLPPSNHLVSYSTTPDSRTIRVVVETTAMRFSDEGANEYR